jgi:hypothetical protein
MFKILFITGSQPFSSFVAPNINHVPNVPKWPLLWYLSWGRVPQVGNPCSMGRTPMAESLLIEYSRPSYPWPNNFRPIGSCDRVKCLTEWQLRIGNYQFNITITLGQSQTGNVMTIIKYNRCFIQWNWKLLNVITLEHGQTDLV